MTREELKENLYVALGYNIYKVSTLYENGFTATLLWPVQNRTRVHHYSYEQLCSFTHPTDREVRRMEKAYGLPTRAKA